MVECYECGGEVLTGFLYEVEVDGGFYPVCSLVCERIFNEREKAKREED